MKKFLTTTALLLFIASFAHAQYKMAVGIRSGGTSGLTVKAITSQNMAVEGIIGFWNDGLSFTGLIERHPNAFNTKGLHWLLGVGGHVNVYNARSRGYKGLAWYEDHPGIINDGVTGIGLDALAGIEYKFPSAPMAISFELKPYAEFSSMDRIWISLDPGIGFKIAW